MAVTNLVLAKIYMDPDQKAELMDLAKRTGIPFSELGRRLLAGRRIPNQESKKDLLKLLECNADLARLGNLLKLALDNEEFEKTQYNKGLNTEELLQDIRMRQNEIKALIREFKAT